MSLGRKQFLPRPKRLHAMVEDFLATWDAPTSHILPLRRYIENILQTDLRNFYVNRCLKLALLYRDLPESCNTGLLKGRGLVATPDMLAVSAESELYRKMKWITAGNAHWLNERCNKHGSISPRNACTPFTDCLSEIKTWMNNFYFHFMWNVIAHPCPEFNGSLAKPTFHLWPVAPFTNMD